MKPMASTMEGTELPKTDTKTAARAMPGKLITTSMMRMMTSEIHLRLTAATEPMMQPPTRARRVAPKPMARE